MMRDGECWELSMPELLTSGNESGSWPTPHGFSPDGRTNGPSGNELGRAVNRSIPTPTASMMTMADMEQAKYAGNGGKRPSYQDAKQWPTPTAACANGGQTSRSGKRKGELLLAGAVKAFPTPKARDWKDTGTVPPSRVADPGKDTLGQHVARTEPGGSLNPTWVEWLMGWPLGWTDSAQSATGKFRQWSASHGISSDRP
jgi:hypothetical protein